MMDLLLATFAITSVAMALGMAGMAIGYMARGRCLRGSCGGAAADGADDRAPRCNDCPHRRAADPGTRPGGREQGR
jgi:hypothetical protein